MSNIVKYTEFKKVVDALWSRVKTNFITDVTYNPVDKTLNKTKNNQNEEITKVVTEWQDLEYTTQSNNFNIFNTLTFEDGKYFAVNGLPMTDANWGNFKIVCNPGDVFTLFKKQHDSKNLGLMINDSWIENLSVGNGTIENNWVKYTFTIPQTQQFNAISIPVYKPKNNYKNEVMLFSGDVNAPSEYIPFTNNRVVSIDGSKVALTFDATDTSLKSSTTYDAIKELDKKSIKSVNNQQPQDGNITVNAEHIGYDGTTSNIIATDVQTAIDKLKEDVNLLPNASIYIVPNKQELYNLLNRNVLNHGDLVYVIDSTGVVDFDNQPADGGNPVAMIYDTSLSATTNRLRVFSRFSSNVNVSANNVSYDDNATQLNAQNVQGAIEKLNEKIANVGGGAVTSVNGQQGNVTLDATHINALVGGRNNTVQQHMQNMNSNITLLFDDVTPMKATVNNHANRIATLETKVPDVRVGDVITTYRNSNADYVVNGVTYLYIGRTRAISSATYPQLATALGLTNVGNFQPPVINDVTHNFDNTRTATRRSFICANIA